MRVWQSLFTISVYVCGNVLKHFWQAQDQKRRPDIMNADNINTLNQQRKKNEKKNGEKKACTIMMYGNKT